MTTNPYILLSLLIAWAASLAVVGIWQRHDGETVERSAWTQRENAQIVTANAAIKSLEDAARATEQAHAGALATISTDYEGKIQNATTQHATDLAAVRAGTLRLRDPNAPGKCPAGNSMPGIASGPGVGDGRAPGELSSGAVEFLLSEASRADAIAEQLAASQAVIRSDRAP